MKNLNSLNKSQFADISNITENKKAIIIDFDNVIKSEEFQNENEPMTNNFGKLSTAPEINKTYQSDIFSIGYIMHHILHGEPPEIQTNDENGNITIITNDNFLYKECFDIDPKKRPKIEELYESFSNYEYIRLKELLDFFNNDCQVYKKISEDCDGIFFYQLGKYFMQKNQIDKVFYCYTMAANRQNATAQAELGILFYKGKYLPKDMNKSICYFTLAANQNNAQAQYYLGILHIEGEEIPQNINKGFHYLDLAINQNYPEAQYDLGVFYFYGKYLSQNIDKAIYYFNLAANQNLVYAQYTLGNIYKDGLVVPRDIKKAILYHTLAANQNYSYSQDELGIIYFNDEPSLRDIEKSIHYLTLAANQNNSDAQYCLGMIYYKKEFNHWDINKALYYFEISAKKIILHLNTCLEEFILKVYMFKKI